jgi:simple sugar transport system ATP-binding protein
MAAGIGMVTQEFSLVETMTVRENVALSGIGLGRVDASGDRRRVEEAMARLGVSLDPEQLVSTLSIGERQRVEIVKALFHECRVLILDEPTAVLTPQDVDALFATVERLRAAGMGVLFVSHKLREVARISDRVVVLRRGRLVADRVTAEVGEQDLAALMMGGAAAVPAAGDPSLPDVAPVTPRRSGSVGSAGSVGPAVLEVRNLSVRRQGRPVLNEVSLTVGAGEILGLAGISGNGQTDLVGVLAGVVVPTTGTVTVDGTDVTWADVPTRLAAGLGRLTEDRRGSLVPQHSVEHNLVIEDLSRFTRRGLLDRAAVRAHAEELIERFDIRARPTDGVATLSGGNMQKVLLARALSRPVRVLVAAQPTRGLDLGSCGYVHRRLADLREEGSGVLLVSEDLDELRALCDRIAVLFRGEIVGEVRAEEATREGLGVLMTGGRVAA